MRELLKRVGLESIWLVLGCALGAFTWIGVASYYNEVSDAYWTANGHPPPLPEYATPDHLRFVFLFAPYAATVAIRLLLVAAARWRPMPT